MFNQKFIWYGSRRSRTAKDGRRIGLSCEHGRKKMGNKGNRLSCAHLPRRDRSARQRSRILELKKDQAMVEAVVGLAEQSDARRVADGAFSIGESLAATG